MLQFYCISLISLQHHLFPSRISAFMIRYNPSLPKKTNGTGMRLCWLCTPPMHTGNHEKDLCTFLSKRRSVWDILGNFINLTQISPTRQPHLCPNTVSEFPQIVQYFQSQRIYRTISATCASTICGESVTFPEPATCPVRVDGSSTLAIWIWMPW